MKRPGQRSSSAAAPLVLLALTTVASMLLLTGCVGDDIVSLSFGSLEVRTQTTGANLDADGYQVRITSSEFDATFPVGVNDMLAVTVAGGRTYTVSSNDIAANCSPDLNPQTAFVARNTTVTIVFDIGCV